MDIISLGLESYIVRRRSTPEDRRGEPDNSPLNHLDCTHDGGCGCRCGCMDTVVVYFAVDHEFSRAFNNLILSRRYGVYYAEGIPKCDRHPERRLQARIICWHARTHAHTHAHVRTYVRTYARTHACTFEMRNGIKQLAE